MFSTVNREVHTIVVKSTWRPCRLTMALFTIRRELCGTVVRVICTIVIIQVASDTSIRCVVVIAIVTSVTVVCNSSVCPIQRINGIMVKGTRTPCCFVVTTRAIR